MIMLKSINGDNFCLNSDLIYKIEQAPDTIITLVDGKKLRVADDTHEIVAKIIEYKKQIYNGPAEVKE